MESSALDALFIRAEAARWGVSVARFREALEAAVSHDADPTSIHLQDFALSLACADGIEAAWEHFVAVHRPGLYRAADAIDRTGGARESADALLADLFGVRQKDGVRQSLFRYYHGRSKLDTWLRAVLAQRHVDRIRASRKLEALPDDDGARPLASNDEAPDAERGRFAAAIQHALSAAINALDSRDRLRLRLYYAQHMKLAAIGRMLGEHEATVSRHLTRTRAEIRDLTETALRQRHGFDDRAVAECFQRVAADPGALDLGRLIGADGKFGVADRSTNKERV
jgi:RNA polymerase sigma-70 factor (ECF subfamily)